MARMIGLQQGNFPRFSSWLRNDLPKLPGTNPNTWTAFQEHSLLSNAQAIDCITHDRGPLIFIEDLGSRFGLYSASNPDLVSIGQRLISAYERRAGARTDKAVEATVLHEMVHWALAGREFDANGQPAECGELFELDAYGEVVSVELPVEPAVTPIRTAAAPPPAGDRLGMLSRRYEANGNPGAIGRDQNGGWSYGLYQLASRQGTVATFLDFLARAANADYAQFARDLIAAGGDQAARLGSTTFVATWKRLADVRAFSSAQHDFIKTRYYDRFILALQNIGIEIATRSGALNDVAWSISVQHGPRATWFFSRPWASLSPADRLDDRAFINAIYDERSRVDVYFSKSTPAVRLAVKKRFDTERRDALAMLA